MEEIKPVKPEKIDGVKYWNPEENKYNLKYPVCVCGFELVKESENTYRCTGEHHRYIMQHGDFIFDKFGKVWLKKPDAPGDKNKNGK